MGNTVEIKLPAVVTLVNGSDRAIGIVPYRENFTAYIPAGDTLKLEAETAGQVLYYKAQATDGLTFNQAAKASS